MSVSPGDFRNAMRGLASGVSLVTTCDASGQWHGMAATAVMSVSAEPPRILICVNKTASMHAPLLQSGCYGVSFLAAGQEPLVGLFSDPAARARRFADPGWNAAPGGAPLHKGAVAALDCRVVERIDSASHTIFVGEVLATTGSPGAAPVIHYQGGLGGFTAAA